MVLKSDVNISLILMALRVIIIMDAFSYIYNVMSSVSSWFQPCGILVGQFNKTKKFRHIEVQ